ncbi:MAG: insulinase family protein [Chloroflexi bacterium]|nr:insulinase family protein [Chloroflexota bacterium]
MNPAVHKTQNLPGTDTIDRFILPNGITLLSYSNFNTHSVDLIGLIEAGGAADPKQKLGLAHFTAMMLSRGTRKRNFSEYHELLESRGASLSFSCGTRNTWFRGKSLAEDLEMLIDLAAESLQQPAFPPEYVERLRNQLIAGLAIRDQDTSEVASLLFDQNIFPGHPYGDPVDGTIDTVGAIQREDLMPFHRDYFTPSQMIVVVAGAVESNYVRECVEKFFGKWENVHAQEFIMPPVPDAPHRIVRSHRTLEEKSQTDLQIGTLGPSRKSEDYLPVYLGNNILGQFGLMGRIGESVRSKSGLAYHASSSINGWQEAGTWEFSAGLNPENLEKVIDLIRSEISRFVEEPVTEEELDDSKSHLIGRLPLSLETNSGIANGILTMERFDLGLDYYQRYPALIESISAQQILEISGKYLHPDRLVIASAGSGNETG